MSQLLEYASNHPFLSGAAVFVVLLVIANEFRVRAGGSKLVDTATAVRMMNDGSAVVDIRSTERFATGHLIGAKNIPADQIESATDKLSKMAKKPLVVYCENGVSCNKALGMLRSKGIEQAVAIRGGVTAWKQDDLPLVKG